MEDFEKWNSEETPKIEEISKKREEFIAELNAG